MSIAPAEQLTAEAASPRVFEARVESTRWEAEGIATFVLCSADGDDLPAWEPGAHIDIRLPSGLTRQFSLCGDVADRQRYRIGVLHQASGRGGSMEAHRELRAGARVVVGEPRSTFRLADADEYLFVAGGIGITPLLPMIRAAATAGIRWRLVYAARSTAHFAFLAELAQIGGGQVDLYNRGGRGRPDLGAIVDETAGAAVYCCGPATMITEMQDAMARVGRTDQLHYERFVPSAPPPPSAADAAAPRPIRVTLARSGQTITVGARQSILEGVREAGVAADSSCEMGICGTCETRVLSGRVDHRDDLLTDEERATGDTMMICVSRAVGDELTLDR